MLISGILYMVMEARFKAISAIRNIHLSAGALERSVAQSAHCLMVLINGLPSSGAFAHYCVLFMLSWVMMPTQQLLLQPFG